MRPADYAQLIREGATTCPSDCSGLFARVLRGRQPSDFKTLTDDPARRLVMLFGEADLAAMVGRTPYEMLLTCGYEIDYIARKVAEGNQFKLLVFDGRGDAMVADWDGVLEMVRLYYPRVQDMVARHLDALRVTPFGEIEARTGFSFADVDKRGPEDLRFVTEERLLMGEGSLEEVRAFLYFTLHLRELYSGDGYTYTPDGVRGLREYIIPNLFIRQLTRPVLIDLDLRLPS